MSLPEQLETRRARVDRALDRLLPPPAGPARAVAEAMRYAVLGGGKRLRPLLTLLSYEACGGAGDEILEPACALELVHTYSLIHDDLPAMDDDDLRRGRASVHRRFGEAVAILAGDALLTLSFEVLATRPAGPSLSARRAEAVALVAVACGLEGMIGGQIADLEAEGRTPEASMLAWIHRRKTGSLISAACEVGALHAGATAEMRALLAAFGRDVGLAFQIADDLLDRTATAARLGKTPGKDRRSGKATYPALHGVEASRTAAETLARDAQRSLRDAGVLTPALAALASFAVSRDA